MTAEWLLVMLVCGAYDCHMERIAYYKTQQECVEAAGYDMLKPPRKHPSWKCIVVIRTGDSDDLDFAGDR